MKKVCVVTGTRAEYGLLKPLMQRFNSDNAIELQIIATGMHLSAEYGFTYQEIEKDGFTILEKNEMLLNSDTPSGITKSIGVGMIGYADIFTRIKPDILVLLGDRYEILPAAVAALMHRIPIAHIHGGELTEGAVDESIRHVVTKMSSLHFTATEEYKNRVIQMGEQPENVFNVGALGVENIQNVKLLSREELANRFGNIFGKEYVMVTFHPVTLEKTASKEEFEEILSVLSEYEKYNFVFTYANADTDGKIINQLIERYTREHSNTKAFQSMGQLGYLSALKYCDFVMGNSSSGIIEAPSFHIPTINIGSRQKGRARSKTVIDCGYTKKNIQEAFQKATNKEFVSQCKLYDNPYEGIDTSKRIYEIIKDRLDTGITVTKQFHDL